MDHLLKKDKINLKQSNQSLQKIKVHTYTAAIQYISALVEVENMVISAAKTSL